MKKISILLVAVLTLTLLFSACGKDSALDIPVTSLDNSIDIILDDAEGLKNVDTGYITNFLKVDEEMYEDASVRINAKGVNINEYGIFKCASADEAKKVKAALEDYLKLRMDSWMDEYMPEEKPKLESAETKVIANYAFYAILSDSERSDFFDIMTDELK